MKNTYTKNVFRTITKSKGRYFAIMAIIALGVGFFSGLKVTKPAMIENANSFYEDTNFFDLRLVSNYGFTEDEVCKLQERNDVLIAEGSYSIDFMNKKSNDDEAALKAISISESINTIEIKEGRMPQNDKECVVDASKLNPQKQGYDLIGSKIIISDSNSDEVSKCFKYTEYEIVGLVYSPLYLSFERGTTSLGDGKLQGFVYIPKDGFDMPYYTELYVDCQDEYHIYDTEYVDYIDKLTPDIEAYAKENAVEKLIDLNPSFNGVDKDLIPDEVINQIEESVEIYVLDRTSNTGYACYDNDTSIVEGLAEVFPVFFFLIAALVCSTTMARMVDDERGQIGTLRALGYSNFAIIGKYLIYSGTAAIIGCIVGFFLGCLAFPFAIGEAYKMLYDFGRSVEFYFNSLLLVIALMVSLLCSAGTTYLACRKELKCMPAELIRPKAPIAGKRILLERITPIWKKMKFLHKITARNVFRFKKRMIMMIMGISGCTALVIAGFGIKNSVSNIAEFQYDEIETYDMELIFSGEISDSDIDELRELVDEDLTGVSPLYKTTVKYVSGDTIKSVYLCAAEHTDMDKVINYETWSGSKDYPGYGQVMISDGLAEVANLKVGDNITFSDDNGKEMTLEISGIYKNYVWHYGFVTPETFEEFWGENYAPNTLYLNVKEDADSYDIGAMLGKQKNIIRVSVVEEVRNILSNTMKTLDVIVWLVIGCAGALAFIVLFNLSNINITERVREIATIKVLGFYQGETGAYVFRENLVLTLMGIVVGLPLGYFLNGFIIAKIKIDMFIIKETLFFSSYVFTVVLVILFLVIADLVMRHKIEKIHMAESLKSIE